MKWLFIDRRLARKNKLVINTPLKVINSYHGYSILCAYIYGYVFPAIIDNTYKHGCALCYLFWGGY